MTRTFVAIELPDEVRAHLTRTIGRLSRALPDIRWVQPDTLHLTLAFLGELDDAALAAVREATEATAGDRTPFALRTDRLGTFGPPHAPRVVWMGVGGDLARLRTVQAALVRRLETAGFPREQRPYSPHLTLARLNAPLAAPALARLQTFLSEAGKSESAKREVTWQVDALSVMKSDLGHGGARYTPLAVYRLGAGA